MTQTLLRLFWIHILCVTQIESQGQFMLLLPVQQPQQPQPQQQSAPIQEAGGTQYLMPGQNGFTGFLENPQEVLQGQNQNQNQDQGTNQQPGQQFTQGLPFGYPQQPNGIITPNGAGGFIQPIQPGGGQFIMIGQPQPLIVNPYQPGIPNPIFVQPTQAPPPPYYPLPPSPPPPTMPPPTAAPVPPTQPPSPTSNQPYRPVNPNPNYPVYPPSSVTETAISPSYPGPMLCPPGAEGHACMNKCATGLKCQQFPGAICRVNNCTSNCRVEFYIAKSWSPEEYCFPDVWIPPPRGAVAMACLWDMPHWDNKTACATPCELGSTKYPCPTGYFCNDPSNQINPTYSRPVCCKCMDKPVGYCPLTLRVNLGMDVGSGGGSSMPLGFNPPPPGGDIGGSSKQYWSVAQGRFVELPNNHIWNYVLAGEAGPHTEDEMKREAEVREYLATWLHGNLNPKENMGKDPMGDGLLENVNVTDFIIERMRNFQPITPTGQEPKTDVGYQARPGQPVDANQAGLCETDCECSGIRKCCPLLYSTEDHVLDPTFTGPKACMPASSRPEVAQMAKIMKDRTGSYPPAYGPNSPYGPSVPNGPYGPYGPPYPPNIPYGPGGPYGPTGPTVPTQPFGPVNPTAPVNPNGPVDPNTQSGQQICNSKPPNRPAGWIQGFVDGQPACFNGGRCYPNANSNVHYSCDCSPTAYGGPRCDCPRSQWDEVSNQCRTTGFSLFDLLGLNREQ